MEASDSLSPSEALLDDNLQQNASNLATASFMPSLQHTFLQTNHFLFSNLQIILMSRNTTCLRCRRAVSSHQQANLLTGHPPKITQYAGHTLQQVTWDTGPNCLMSRRTNVQLCTPLLLDGCFTLALTLMQAAAAAGAEDHMLLPMTS